MKSIITWFKVRWFVHKLKRYLKQGAVKDVLALRVKHFPSTPPSEDEELIIRTAIRQYIHDRYYASAEIWCISIPKSIVGQIFAGVSDSVSFVTVSRTILAQTNARIVCGFKCTIESTYLKPIRFTIIV